MTPLEALQSLIGKAFLHPKYGNPNRPKKPGELVESASPETREALQNLKSDDLQIRLDYGLPTNNTKREK